MLCYWSLENGLDMGTRTGTGEAAGDDVAQRWHRDYQPISHNWQGGQGVGMHMMKRGESLLSNAKRMR